MNSRYTDLINQALEKIILEKEPANLYEPIRYILSIGGKRMRPALLIHSHELFGGKAEEAINYALAIELFHNFSLVHDDIMDRAELRRGNKTVHSRWNENIAILSGDAMLVKAYQLLIIHPNSHTQKILEVFSKTALEVCEGQQMDMDFEQRKDVRIADYIQMITLKTAVLLGASLKIGAISAGASEEDAEKIYNFGVLTGIAFQLQDDKLDVFGNEEKFGKRKGGDIASNKKTFLYLSSLKNANPNIVSELSKMYEQKTFDESKLNRVIEIFKLTGAEEEAIKEIEKYYSAAMKELDGIHIDEAKKQDLRNLASMLLERQF